MGAKTALAVIIVLWGIIRVGAPLLLALFGVCALSMLVWP